MSPEVIKSSRIVENIRKNFHAKYCQNVQQIAQNNPNRISFEAKGKNVENDLVLFRSSQNFSFDTPKKGNKIDTNDTTNLSKFKDDTFKKSFAELSSIKDHKIFIKKILSSSDLFGSKTTGTKASITSKDGKLMSLGKLRAMSFSLGSNPSHF